MFFKIFILPCLILGPAHVDPPSLFFGGKLCNRRKWCRLEVFYKRYAPVARIEVLTLHAIAAICGVVADVGAKDA